MGTEVRAVRIHHGNAVVSRFEGDDVVPEKLE
jgi:hypothetical protein